MFFVKEFNSDGSFIGFTQFCDKKEALALLKRIEKYQPEIVVFVSHIFYDKQGTLNERIL